MNIRSGSAMERHAGRHPGDSFAVLLILVWSILPFFAANFLRGRVMGIGAGDDNRWLGCNWLGLAKKSCVRVNPIKGSRGARKLERKKFVRGSKEATGESAKSCQHAIPVTRSLNGKR